MKKNIENLSEIMHLAWIDSMRCILANADYNSDGSITLSKDDLHKITLGMGNEYKKLDDKERDFYRTKTIKLLVEMERYNEGSAARDIDNIIIHNGYIMFQIDNRIYISVYDEEGLDIDNIIENKSLANVFIVDEDEFADDKELALICDDFVETYIADTPAIVTTIYRDCIVKQVENYDIHIESMSYKSKFKKLIMSSKNEQMTRHELNEFIASTLDKLLLN